LLLWKRLATTLVGKTSKHPLIRYLQWDSDFFGVPVASLDGGLLQSETSKIVFDWCRKEKIRCLYFLADGTDSHTLQCAYDEGFQFIDVRVKMEYDLKNVQQTEASSLEIKPVTKKEKLDNILAFARMSHTDSRFFKDLNFDRIKCEKLYEEWIYRDFEKGNVVGFYPEGENNIKGYVTFTMESPDVARIGLIAVEDQFRGQGVGTKLLRKTIVTSKELNARKLIVVTQATNTSALRLYEKAGFRISDTKIWFHKWFA
jgi:dTDP-4-amino-4,6-dideoxy-D-galactose acyltransferase